MLQQYYSHNSNMKCHNLCTKIPPPNNHAILLGLGGKYYLQSRRLNPNKLNTAINRFKHDVRVKYYVLHNIGINNDSPKLYFKSANTTIPREPTVIGGALYRFEKEIRSAFRLQDKRYGTNITKLQENVLKYF